LEIVRYRLLRLSCRITVTELARVIGISSQRLSQIELHPLGYKPENPERLIVALENAVKQQITMCESTLDKCRNRRTEMFEYINGSEG